MYTIRLLQSATRELERLDKTVVSRILGKLRWLSENVDNINQQQLKGRLSGLYKLREGDYRIVYEVLRPEQTIIVHLIGHRSEVYKSPH